METALAKKPIHRPTGMAAFLVVWSGQLVSLVGTGMTNFALSIYIWQTTGQATPFALIGFFWALPMIAFTPFAGALVDRWNRKLTMMISDIAGLLVNLVMVGLLIWGHLEMWHLYALVVFNGLFSAFQWPAYSAAISTMLDKRHFARANALMSVAQSGSTIFAPVIAAILIAIMGISGILMLGCRQLPAGHHHAGYRCNPSAPQDGVRRTSQEQHFPGGCVWFSLHFPLTLTAGAAVDILIW